MSSLKRAELTIREWAHINGGRAFFAYEYRCDQEPRLTRFDRYDKKTRSVTSTWRVDGVDQPDLNAALQTLGIE